jgi:hypothetical protein
MAALALSGCADVPPPPPAAAPVAAAPTPAPASPSGIVLGPQQQGTTLANDPSAPLDTPLCGIQARENNTMGQALLAQQYARAGICSSFACYDPATATYLGADGYRHVCR